MPGGALPVGCGDVLVAVAGAVAVVAECTLFVVLGGGANVLDFTDGKDSTAIVVIGAMVPVAWAVAVCGAVAIVVVVDVCVGDVDTRAVD